MGLNHQTAPVELRECLAFTSDETVDLLKALSEDPSISEALLFSTCNRVELVVTTENTDESVDLLKNFISRFKKISVNEFDNALYIHTGDEAVRHVFRVASSLDSMMVGEPQILGQVKDAYTTAIEAKTSGVILNRLLHKTFSVAKRVRTETGIGDHAVSISYAAIELGRKIFGDLKGKKVLLIGAGEMAELAVEHLIRNRATDIYVANRTFERGVELAKNFNGEPVRFEEIPACLKFVDIIIGSTGSPEYVIQKNQVKGVIRERKNRPLFFIDIAVPRDIDPEINKLTNSYVYDIDDLKGVIDDNIEDRRREAVKGERIVDEAVIRFRQWFESLDVVPTIIDLRKKLESIAEAEMKKTVGILNLDGDEVEALNRMAKSIVKKFLHDPTIFLKNGYHSKKSVYIDMARKLFQLDD